VGSCSSFIYINYNTTRSKKQVALFISYDSPKITEGKLIIKQNYPNRYNKTLKGVCIPDTLFLYLNPAGNLRPTVCVLRASYVAKFKAIAEHCKPR
jgi:hypothetical protein